MRPEQQNLLKQKLKEHFGSRWSEIRDNNGSPKVGVAQEYTDRVIKCCSDEKLVGCLKQMHTVHWFSGVFRVNEYSWLFEEYNQHFGVSNSTAMCNSYVELRLKLCPFKEVVTLSDRQLPGTVPFSSFQSSFRCAFKLCHLRHSMRIWFWEAPDIYSPCREQDVWSVVRNPVEWSR